MSDTLLLIPDLESKFDISLGEVIASKFDTILGKKLVSKYRGFLGIFRILEMSMSLPDGITLDVGDAIMYVNPDLSLPDNALVRIQQRTYRLVSQELAKYIGATPIYRVLGLEEYMPAKEIGSFYDVIQEIAQVSGLRAEADAAYNIDTYWNAIDDDDLDHFKIHRSTSTGFTPSDTNLVALPTTNSFKHNDLAAATTYYFKVAAVTKLGAVGTYSSQASATTPA